MRTSATDEELALRWQSGDASAKEELTERYWACAGFEAKDALVPMTDEDDRRAECLVALVFAAGSFKPARGATFKSYAIILMRRRMVDMARRVKCKSRAGDLVALSFDQSALEYRGEEPCESGSLSEVAGKAQESSFEFERVRGSQAERLISVMAGDESRSTHAVRESVWLYSLHLKRNQEVLAHDLRWISKLLKRKSGQMVLFPPGECLPTGRRLDVLRSIFSGFLTLIVLVCEDLAAGLKPYESRAKHGVDKRLMGSLLGLVRSELTVAA